MYGNVHLEKIPKVNNMINKDSMYRDRVSIVENIVDIKHIYDKIPHKINEIIRGSATSIHNNLSYVEMKVFNKGDKVIRQSKEYFIYQSGKSKSCLFTGVLNVLDNTEGFVSRIGCFDDINDKKIDKTGNGIFFELVNNNFSIVLRSGNGGFQNEIKIHQKNFSYDKLNGKGPSNKNIIIFDKYYLFSIDFHWLGAGVIRFFIYFDGKPFLLHVINNNNISAPYMKYGTLPIRYEIEKIEDNNRIGEMRQSCSTIQIEGGYNPLYINTQENILYRKPIKVNFSNFKSIFSIKLKDKYNRALVRDFQIKIFNQNNNTIFMGFIVNPVFLNHVNYNWIKKENSIIKYSLITEFIDENDLDYICSDYVSGNSTKTITSKLTLNNARPLTSNIEGYSDIFTVIVSSISKNKDDYSSIYCAFDWNEFY